MYNRNWKPGMSRTQHKTAGGIKNSDLDSLLSFAEAYASLGSAVQEQVYDLFMGDFDDINPSAVQAMARKLKGKNNELDSLFTDFQQWWQGAMGESIRLGSTRKSSSKDIILERFREMWAHRNPKLNGRSDVIFGGSLDIVSTSPDGDTITIAFEAEAEYSSIMSGDPEEYAEDALHNQVESVLSRIFGDSVLLNDTKDSDFDIGRGEIQGWFEAEVYLPDALKALSKL